MSAALDPRITEALTHAAALPAAAGSPPWQAALAALRARGLPGARDENWKYANLGAFARQDPTPVTVGGEPPEAALPPALPGCARYLLVDGRLLPQRSAALTATAAEISALAAGAGASDPPAAVRDDERFALLNATLAPGGLRLCVPSGSTVRVELLYVASTAAASGTSYPRLALELAAGAECVLIERHLGTGGAAASVNAALDVALARGARLEHYRLQELGAGSRYLDTLTARLAADAQYRVHAIASGALSARSTVALTLGGERAEASYALAALGAHSQVQDTYVVTEHAAADTRSEQTFRGIAAGRARVACNGKVVVKPGARGSDSRQSLRGLLAGADAEIDVRPQLEIHTDDVRCSHGATAGKLDDAMLYYLLSRGLDPELAQRLLKWAFLEDVVAQFALPPLRRQIEERLAGALGDETLRELL